MCGEADDHQLWQETCKLSTDCLVAPGRKCSNVNKACIDGVRDKGTEKPTERASDGWNNLSKKINKSRIIKFEKIHEIITPI